MYTNNKLTKSVRLAIAFGAASAFVGTAVAQEAAADEETAKVERIEVTGSRIKRTDLEGSVPVTVIDRAAIDFSGQTSVSDLIRNTSFNTSGSFRPQSGSSAQGVSQVNLRGLGAERSLILIDGRRLPKSPSTGNSQDLNSIPMAAVERIEILSDGASAVYGSDAIAGVINIITRKDFNGVEVRLGQSSVSIPAEGGDREEGSAVFGTSSGKASMVGGVSWNNRDIIFQRDFPWVSPGASSFGVNFRDVAGTPNRNPVFRSIVSDDQCNGLENFYRTGPICAYNFNATNANEASTGNSSGFLKAEYEINDDWKIFSHTMISKTKSFGRYAPSLNDSTPFMAADSINNPTNPLSPYHDASNPDHSVNRTIEFRHRFAALGNRDSQVDNWSTDFLIGAEGQVGDVFIDFGARKNKNKTYEIGRNYLLGSAAINAINDGSYLVGDPFGARFTTDAGKSSYNALLNSLKVTTARIGIFDQEEAFASASFDVAELQSGMVQAVVGAEYRKETYADIYDSLSEAGVVGGSAGNSAGGSRDLKSAFAEILVPITDDLEMSVAGRFDKYSDYGNDFSPKVSFKYDVMDGLVLRASYGEGFRAPTLDILTQQPSPGNPSVQDAATCVTLGLATNCNIQVSAITLANSELGSESSKQLSLGMAYQPTDWLNFSVDYYDIEIENLIRFFGIATLLTRESSGAPIPAGLGVARNSQGGIELATQGYGNDGNFAISGLDFNVNTNFDFGDYGRLNQTLQLSHRLSTKIDGGRNTVEDPGEPRQRAVFNNVYAFGNFDIGYNLNYIGSQYSDVTNGVQSGHWGSWVTHDIQASYSLPTQTKISVGVNNVFEKFPTLGTDPGFSRDYNFDLYDGYGRIVYVRLSQSF
ncbi:TonB-dependent receptor [Rheinheimera sp. UJ63]|uniref:TonB-dependent receptor n=1 Tax=Rheinheimera sp. UJ63 TaxID=2910157 RepID=UPI001F27679B|nr:TonB-dependent receptor [Rheinheimera sp. UJ63]MCF4008059.1 TonB-dependent receptor [Rheinheimera sp. UJ63]